MTRVQEELPVQREGQVRRAQGVQGLKGDTGAAGAKGATGAQGVAGPQGAAGLKGLTVDNENHDERDYLYTIRWNNSPASGDINDREGTSSCGRYPGGCQSRSRSFIFKI
ncbi:MAG: hypothetical protein ACLTZT_00915 [Butyricimonas faecalis]